MPSLRNILRATFVLPCTAGLIKGRRNGGFSVHDGSIAGIVLLTTAVIIIFEVIIVIPVEKSRLLMISFVGLAIACLLLCSITAGCRDHWTAEKTVKSSNSLKLKFLWFFFLGNLIYQILILAVNIECKTNNTEVTLFFILTWAFQFFQTLFITYFSRFRFANILGLYYGLLVLFVTNISLWTQDTVYEYVMKHTTTTTNSSHNTNSTLCLQKSILEKTVEILEPYLEPVFLEYCLLSLIFISEMWPKSYSERERKEFVESVSLVEDYETQPLLLNVSKHTEETFSRRHRSSVCVFVLGMTYTLSFIIVESIFIYIPGMEPNIIVSNAFFAFGNLVRMPLTIKCFYAFSGQLRPKSSSQKWMNMSNFVLITTSFVTCGFYIIECFLRSDSSKYEIPYLINSVIRVMATMLQTAFILQMKQYKKMGDQKYFMSIQNTFLFMCCINFGIWFSYTFVTPRYSNELRTKAIFENIYFPFAVFYHFECFIAFYKFFTE